MPLNYDKIRQAAAEYQWSPNKVTRAAFEAAVLEMLANDNPLDFYDWHIDCDDWNEERTEFSWEETLNFLRAYTNNYARDLFIGALIDVLNERDLLP